MQRSRRREAFPRPTDRYPLGASGLHVSPICLGATSPETVRAAFDAGINFFFISNDLHWHMYEPSMVGLRTLLASGVRRDDIVVASVSYLGQPMFQYLQFDEMIDAIPGLERVDLVIAGCAVHDNFLSRVPSLRRACDERKWGCRAIGASFHDRSTALVGIRSELLDLAYVRYNPAHPNAELDLFPQLPSDRTCLTYNFKSTIGFVGNARCRELGLDDSFWKPSITDTYRFALTRPELDGLLVAPETPAQLAELVTALESPPLTEEEAAYLKDLVVAAAGRATLAQSG